MNDLCKVCGAVCCQYFALQIDTPTTRGDFENIRWYLSHYKVSVFIQEGKWFLKVANRCRYLGSNGHCQIYEHRPAICKKHNPKECEYHDPKAVKEIRTPKQLQQYLEGQGMKGKKRKVR